MYIRHGRWGMEHIFQATEYGKLNSKNFLLKEFLIRSGTSFRFCACVNKTRKKKFVLQKKL